MKLGDLVDADDIIIGVRAADIGSAAAKIFEEALPHHGFAAGEVRRLAAAVVAREREMPTTCGASAIPHARDPQVQSFIAVIGTNREGIVEGQRDPRVIIAFLSPSSKTTEHLELLASLSRLAHDSAAIDAIANAATSEQIATLLKR